MRYRQYEVDQRREYYKWFIKTRAKHTHADGSWLTQTTFFVFSAFAFGLRTLYRLWPKGESHYVIGVLCIQYFRRCTTRTGIERRCNTTLYELPSLILIEENRRRKMMPTKPICTQNGPSPSPTRSLSSTIYYKCWIFILMSTHGTRFFRRKKIGAFDDASSLVHCGTTTETLGRSICY